MAIYVNASGQPIINSSGAPIDCSTCPCASDGGTIDACFDSLVADCFQFTTTGFSVADGCSQCLDINRMWTMPYIGTGFGGWYWEETTTPKIILGICGGGAPDLNTGRVRIIDVGGSNCEVFAEVFSTTLLLARWSAVFANTASAPFTLSWNGTGVTAGICNISAAQPTIVVSAC